MSAPPDELARRHASWGWWSLLVFLTLGIALELMHGFKLDWYLSMANETRRLLWRLAHAHGTLLGLVHLAFAWTMRVSSADGQRWRGVASACLIGASVLLPAGFLLGGIVVHGGDPNRSILLVPVGAALLFVAVLLTALKSRLP